MKIVTSTLAAIGMALMASPSQAGFDPPPARLVAMSAARPTTLMAPFVSARGVTKPPGSALGQHDGKDDRLERKSREIDRTIESWICSGCK